MEKPLNSRQVALELRLPVEFDASAVAKGDVIAGSATGTMALIAASGATDGDVLTMQADGTLAYEAVAGGSATGVVGCTIGTVTNGNPSTFTLQLTASGGGDLAEVGAVQYYLADDSLGKDITAGWPDSVAAGTDGSISQYGNPSIVGGVVVSEADGDVDVQVTNVAGGTTWYFVVVLPDGTIVVSEAVTPTA